MLLSHQSPLVSLPHSTPNYTQLLLGFSTSPILPLPPSVLQVMVTWYTLPLLFGKLSVSVPFCHILLIFILHNSLQASHLPGSFPNYFSTPILITCVVLGAFSVDPQSSFYVPAWYSSLCVVICLLICFLAQTLKFLEVKDLIILLVGFPDSVPMPDIQIAKCIC